MNKLFSILYKIACQREYGNQGDFGKRGLLGWFFGLFDKKKEEK